jgi:hypothetical protein
MKNKLFEVFVCMLLIGTCFVVTIDMVSAEQEGDYTYYVSNGEATINGYTGSGGAITIPSALGGYPTVTIGNMAFYACEFLTSVTIPNSVTTIEQDAFAACLALISVTIPNSVTTIGYSAFMNCFSLASVNIPNSVTTIEPWAFSKCSLTSVTIPNSVTTIGDNAFNECSYLASVTIPNSVTTIGKGAFFRCDSLASVTIPNSVTTIGDSAFTSCDLLSSVTIPDTVTTIGESAFALCSLTSVTIPISVTTIGVRAFSDCNFLTIINVDADNVNYVSVDGVLYNKAMTTLIQCPGGKTGAFNIPDSVTTIGESAFALCLSLTFVTIPNSVTAIESWAFSGCSSLASITIPNSVTTIGDYAFGCRKLTSIRFLGLVAPTVGYQWITNPTPAEIRGHAYPTSNFPAPGEKWNGLTMGAYIGSENEPPVDENKPPVASFTWTSSNPNANQTITFDASTSNDPDGSITKYEWDWDNNGVYEKSQNTPTATNSWAQAGSYSVKLQVMDNGGLTSTKTMTVSVNSIGGNSDTNGDGNTSGNGNTNNKGTPGFELVIIIGAILVVMFLFRKKRIV